MALAKQFVTAEEFDKFILQPDLGERIFELIAGRLLKYPVIQNVSAIAQLISFLFGCSSAKIISLDF